MSTEKRFNEGNRWLRTADDDLDAAIILRKNGKFPHACFHAQQAGEKALKALWFSLDADPWGHSLSRLITELKHIEPDLYNEISLLKKSGQFLDRFYIPTRYPNGLPDVTPDEVFNDDDAETCISHARNIIILIEKMMNSPKVRRIS